MSCSDSDGEPHTRPSRVIYHPLRAVTVSGRGAWEAQSPQTSSALPLGGNAAAGRGAGSPVLPAGAFLPRTAFGLALICYLDIKKGRYFQAGAINPASNAHLSRLCIERMRHQTCLPVIRKVYRLSVGFF